MLVVCVSSYFGMQLFYVLHDLGSAMAPLTIADFSFVLHLGLQSM
jgi:hypothetical protein